MATSAWPNVANTGVPVGITLTTVTPTTSLPAGVTRTGNGDLVVNTPGVVLSGLDIRGTVYINASNVTLINCKVTSGGFAVVQIATGVTGTVIQNSTIDGTGNGSGSNGIAGQGTFIANNIYNVENGITLQGNNSIIQDNYIHDLKASGSPHYDGIQIDGSISNATIAHNTVINDYGQTSAVMIDNYFGPISNITVDNNILVGGGYTIYVDGQFNSNPITGVSITNNHMGQGQWGVTDFNGTSPIYTGNVNDGASIPDAPNDGGATLSIAVLSADKAEGQSGSTAFTFTVTRGGDTSIATSASWAVTGSGASPATGSDFAGAALPSGTVSFAAGETSKTISVNVAGDTAVEPDQGFTVTLSNPAASTTIGTASTSGTIRNDDASGGGTSLTYSLFSPGATPGTITENDPQAVNLGIKFQASTNGTIDGIRFYKGPQNTGVHTGDLWTTSGTLLASATFTNETASGWQQVNFSSPVSITAGTTYIASYETTVGEYSEDDNYFTNALTNGPLTALNSVYAYGSSNPFPNSTYRAANYWVDAVFSPSATQTPPALSNVAAFGGFIASTFATPVGTTGTLALASSVSDQDQLAKPAG